MAYFSNGSEGAVFQNQCDRCRYGEKACPIALCQLTFNYDQITAENAGFPQARQMLDILVAPDGTCGMYELDPATFGVDPNQQTLFS